VEATWLAFEGVASPQGYASAALSSLSTSPAEGSAVGVIAQSVEVSWLEFEVPERIVDVAWVRVEGVPYAIGNAVGALASLSTSPAQGSATGENVFSVQVSWLEFEPLLFGIGNAVGELASLSTSPATGTASGAATAAGPLVGVGLTAIQAQSAGAAWVSAELASLGVSPMTGLAQEAVPLEPPEGLLYLSIADPSIYLSAARADTYLSKAG
jgi:hypothetical protein